MGLEYLFSVVYTLKRPLEMSISQKSWEYFQLYFHFTLQIPHLFLQTNFHPPPHKSPSSNPWETSTSFSHHYHLKIQIKIQFPKKFILTSCPIIKLITHTTLAQSILQEMSLCAWKCYPTYSQKLHIRAIYFPYHLIFFLLLFLSVS